MIKYKKGFDCNNTGTFLVSTRHTKVTVDDAYRSIGQRQEGCKRSRSLHDKQAIVQHYCAKVSETI